MLIHSKPKNRFAFPICFVGALFFLCQLHGYSIGEWSKILSVPGPPTLGQARAIRSDDYLASLPIAFSQQKADFSPINPFISFGQKVNFSTYSTPVKDWTLLFRIEAWGYFLNQNFGMSWSWSVKLFGSLLAFYLFFRMAAPKADDLASFLAAIFILYSPLFHYWSLLTVPFILYSLSSVLSITKAIRSKNFLSKAFFSLLFVWFTFAFVLTIYPPMQVICVYFALILFFFFNSVESLREKKNLMAGAFSVTCVGVLTALYFKENAEVISIMKHTDYPGQRFVPGGAGNYFTLFKNNLVSALRPPLNERFGGNICEASAFINLSPLLLVYLFQFRQLSRPFKILVSGALGFSSVLLVWYFFGLPENLDKILGFSMIPEFRALYFIGFLNLIVLALLLHHPLKLTRAHFLWAVSAWVGIHLYPIGVLFKHELKLLWGMIPYFGLLTLAVIFFLKDRLKLGLLIVAGLGIFQTITFNPWVRGGYTELFENSDMKALQAKVGQDFIVVNDNTLGNLPRILGLHNFSGVHYYPQTKLWETLDPDQKSVHAWNRYANVSWKIDQAFTQVQIVAPVPDATEISISPKDPLLQKLGVRFILSPKDKPILGLNSVLEINCCTLYSVGP
jgi:hypothetical protein